MLQPLPRRQEEREGTHGCQLHPLGPRKGGRKAAKLRLVAKRNLSLEPAEEVGAAEQGFARSTFRIFAVFSGF